MFCCCIVITVTAIARVVPSHDMINLLVMMKVLDWMMADPSASL